MKMKTKIKKDWYGRVKSAEELYNDAKLWVSEINFINDEIRFLDRLLSSNYIDFLDAGLEERVDRLVKKIVDERKVGSVLKKQIKVHKRILFGLIKTNSVTSNKNYIEMHKTLERDMHIYLRKYKRIKKSIFDIVENIMRKKEQKRLSTTSNLPI